MASDESLADENARLRARVAQLEDELAAVKQSTAVTVASAQETLYWFERWGVDFNRLFSRREMEVVRKGVRGARQVYRSGVSIKRRIAR
ncbi:MAG: hypothetical protein J7513_16525 [Solirubrobacteraceae bacterium]|nr:hypothetical protein [Solirubrobacteraceae bacterium]